ncbi:acetate--CoA ligase family protein [Prauserella oleivorans]|uniref:Acetate--CoA ligase family protein n=1 Tax=Prauserella oleivorans TaxID=1478153 RepID=A0ABW5WAY5_9PSEU
MASEKLRALYSPSSSAVIGASDNPDKIGGRSIGYLRDYGYAGQVYPVNPRREFVQGLPSYDAVGKIDDPIDLALIATPADRVLEELDACGQQGVRVCVVLSSGFGELGDAGKQLEQRIVEVAHRYSMRVLGPNCQGVANIATGSIASFSTCFATHHVRDGALAIVSQSGAVAGMLSDIHSAHPEGIRYWVASGNEADIGLGELIHEALRDPAVRVVEAYCEHLKRPEELAQAAEYASRSGKAILMLKAGVTPAGSEAAGSHTGALAQDDAVVDAFLRHCGVVRADSLRQISDLAKVFAGRKRARGNGVAILTNSGGLGVMMADRCRAAGLEIRALRPATKNALDAHLPDFAATDNPVDITAELLTNTRLLSQTLPVLAGDPGVDVVVVALGIIGRGYDVAAIVDDITAAHHDSDAVVVVCWTGGDEAAVEELSRRGVATYTDDAACVHAIGRFVEHCRRQSARGRGPAATTTTFAPPAGGSITEWARHASSTGLLSEFTSKRVLRRWNLPVVAGRVVPDADAAVRTAREIGHPVVVKLSSAEVTHKTELGLVVTNLRTDDDVRAAADTVLARAENAGIGSVDGLLVERMALGHLEFAIGARWDDTFGPIVLIGAGGIYVETMADFQLVFPSSTRAQIEDAIRSLTIYPMLENHRGTGPLDRDALVELVMSFSRMVGAAGADLAEVDLNPVFVAPAGHGVSIADALVRLRPPEGAR